MTVLDDSAGDIMFVKSAQSTKNVAAPCLVLVAAFVLSCGGAAAQSVKSGHISSSNKELVRTLQIIDQHVQRESSRASSATDIKRSGTEVTAKYEEERINADAQFEKDQLFNRDPLVIRGRSMRLPEDLIFPTPATERALAEIEERRLIDVRKARMARSLKLEEATNWGRKREDDLNATAENLKCQLLNPVMPSGTDLKNTYTLKAVGTNLYVRQYGPPEQAREVHNATAKVVPFGTVTPLKQAN